MLHTFSFYCLPIGLIFCFSWLKTTKVWLFSYRDDVFLICLSFLSLVCGIVYMQHPDWAGEMPPVMSKTGPLLFFQDLHFAANFQFHDTLKS